MSRHTKGTASAYSVVTVPPPLLRVHFASVRGTRPGEPVVLCQDTQGTANTDHVVIKAGPPGGLCLCALDWWTCLLWAALQTWMSDT